MRVAWGRRRTRLVVPLFGGRPVFVLIFSQAGTLIATPLILILMMVLINKKSLMGDHAAQVGRNTIMGLVILFTLLMTGVGIVGMLG